MSKPGREDYRERVAGRANVEDTPELLACYHELDLQRYAKVTDGSAFEGVLMSYASPATAGPVMQTIGASTQPFRPGEHTRSHRHTGSFVYQIAKGKGCSVIDGRRFDREERDILCVPSWARHEHASASASDDACLFTFNDLPVMPAASIAGRPSPKTLAGRRC